MVDGDGCLSRRRLAAAQAMRRMWTREDPAKVGRGVVDKELWDYGGKVAQARGGMK
jgi:hypothetical protein